ncbi:Cholinephosphotransferase 1 like protein [Argiope bruennichi]|uniref:Cholinephosphotransferase 1 like protein n=1 Tax=Argiope bruennichi TaxID=94029 RepID=A0A8T0F8S4_ARGBR|nr:Cholinephosphotransferase 1 like protein [Argiope bruennichi]
MDIFGFDSMSMDARPIYISQVEVEELEVKLKGGAGGEVGGGAGGGVEEGLVARSDLVFTSDLEPAAQVQERGAWCRWRSRELEEAFLGGLGLNFGIGASAGASGGASAGASGGANAGASGGASAEASEEAGAGGGVFVSLGVCIAVQLGMFPSWMFVQCFIAMTLFYSAHWQTYVSGTLRFGRFDVTEAQYTVMIIHLISAVFGPTIWSMQIPSLYIEIKFIPLFMGIIAASFAFYSNFTVIFTGGAGKNGSTVAIPGLHMELRLIPIIIAFLVSLVLCYGYTITILSGGAGKNGSSVAGTSILSPFIPLALVVVPAFIIYQKSTTNIYEHHPCLYILAFGVVCSKITNKLVVAHMTKSEVEYLDSIFVGPGMLFLNQYFNTFFNEYIVLWLCLIYSTANLLHYCTIVCLQICAYLHINLFVITPQTSPMDENYSGNHSLSAPLLQSVSNDASSETSDLISNAQSPSYQHSFLEELGDS